MISDPIAVGMSITSAKEHWKLNGFSEDKQASLIDADEFDEFSLNIVCGLAETAEILDSASTMLTSNSWDGTVESARNQRDKICEILKVDLSEVRITSSSNSGKSSQPIQKDELDSYEALVREAGY